MKNKAKPLDYIKEVFSNPRDLISVPNILVYLRIILSVLFLAIYIKGVYINVNEPSNWEWGLKGLALDDKNYVQIDGFIACGLILTCAFTDFLDGFIARKFNQKTKLGVFLDPLADKLLQLFIVVGIAYRWGYYYLCKLNGHAQFVIVWILLGILIFKETYMIFGNIIVFVHTGNHFNAAMWYGKLSTAVLYLTMGIMLFFVNLASENSAKTRDLLIIILCYICSVTLLFAFIMYAIKYHDMYKHPEKFLHNDKFASIEDEKQENVLNKEQLKEENMEEK